MNWKAIVKSVAPTLGAALGGPVAGTALKFLADHFLGDTEAQEQDIAELVLNASPEKLVELRSLDNQFKVKMRELDIDVYRLEVDDRKSARDMGIKGGLKAQMVLSFAFIAGYFALTFSLFSGEINMTPAIEQTGTLMLGVITGAIPMILQFWFGSSQGSKEKTQAMVKS
ncbi:hypothetical protein [uncultured Microbulbifer sp.]|uniref:hypothetical protein n=1 Tax=uncultured Microbulbifer sp. TaxID=348147 RepID=UPI002611C812|nr:hypothetical protein [uncultured Microbulbifer sp.]